MKKMFVLLLSLATIMLFGNDNSNHHYIKVAYVNFPIDCEIKDVILQESLIIAAWEAKYILYNFNHYTSEDVSLFTAHGENCAFFVIFNKIDRECEVEFSTEDDSFDYHSFIRVFDSVFLGD